MTFLNFLSFSVVFAFLLVGINFVHFSLFPVDVVFYAAMADGLIASVLSVLLLVIKKKRYPSSGFELTLIFLVWLLSSYAFAITVPTVIDRSLSIYILEKLVQKGGAIERAKFSKVFTDEYMFEFQLVEVRLTEQLQSSTISEENGCISITNFGAAIADITRFYRANFLPKRRLLGNQYSDALVDPFGKNNNKEIGGCLPRT